MPESPKVLIVGAGMGGLTLGLLLERIGVDFEIFERASCVKPLGAAMSIGPNILPMFEQIGMLDEIMKLSLPGKAMEFYSEDVGGLTLIGRTDNAAFLKEKSGYSSIMFSRPDLHKLLLSKIPPNKIHFNKRVLSVGQSDKGVLLRCADGSIYEGDILIGADGAYSAVRQIPQDPEKYPILKDDYSHLFVVVAEGKPHSWTVITVPGNRFCFGVVIQLGDKERDETFRNSEWGPELIDSMIAQVADHKVPCGTLGDLIQATPKELISKVYLEEKLFETWNHDRIALIGDACHKMLPSAGQGAINAMQDAVILANCIYELRSRSHKQIVAALKDYKSQRYDHAKKQVQISSTVGKVFYGQTWHEKLMRRAVFTWMPMSFEERSFFKLVGYRPQVTFQPFVENKTNLKILPQKMSKRYAEEQKLNQENQKS
ncbi:hypothetical protein BGZ79_000497 [Entomortierella chlamydospora]|nr:hypothetical protein BGZ79_000497 [Entomortierella chlamydospora]